MKPDDAHRQGRREPGDTSEQQSSQTPTVRPAGDESERVAGETVDQIGATTAQFPAEVGATETPEARREPAASSTGRHAFLVGAGILLSRIVGLIRQRVFAYYFGVSVVGDAYAAAFRIPNFLQNVFGEGALSASFIPVYAKLLAKEKRGEAERGGADRVAGAVFSLLALVTSLLVLLGVLAAPLLTDVLAIGFEGEKRDLTVSLVRILFPGAGLLVMSAWCLGVLNSHRRFFLSYTAPVIWNCAIIAALALSGTPVHGTSPDNLAVWGAVARYTAWGAVVGSALQFGVQLPTVFRLLGGLRPSLRTDANVRTVVRNFVPVFLSRGVVQISAFVDEMIATLLGDGPVIALTFTQSLYTLPVSLFGMAVSAAALPAMSSAVGDQEKVYAELRQRLNTDLRQISYFIVPSVVGFVVLGDAMVSVLYRTGNFTRADVLYVWAILVGASVGLLPTTLGRLYASAFYALHDTRTPFRFAALHVALAVVLGYLTAIYVPPALGVEMRWGAVGLTASAGVAGWIEFVLLRRKLNARIGRTGIPASYLLKLFAAAFACAAVGWGLKLLSAPLHPIFYAATVLLPYGLLYFAATLLLKVPESRAVVGRFLRPLGRLTGGAKRG
ncbi:MAG TPA: murein biosynthesis integral membrane protein MurJ [Pyrinomonadaceae bacterium]|nr:murein biosynthesis integral membrane protein MurJ [Pyrinomonadaceae bacterium]